MTDLVEHMTVIIRLTSTNFWQCLEWIGEDVIDSVQGMQLKFAIYVAKHWYRFKHDDRIRHWLRNGSGSAFELIEAMDRLGDSEPEPRTNHAFEALARLERELSP